MAEDEGTRRTANALELQQNSNQDQVDAPMGGHTIQDQDLISVGGAGVSAIEFLFCLHFTRRYISKKNLVKNNASLDHALQSNPYVD